jgi:hypothetical protein
MKQTMYLFILIPAVLLIWCIIIYKIIVGTGNSSTIKQNLKTITYIDQPIKIKEQFILPDSFPNPFVQFTKVTTNKINYHRKVLIISKTGKKIPVAYNGMIKQNVNNITYALVTIKNQNKLVKQNDTIDSIKFLKILRDSILVKYEGENIYIKR